jgi:Trk K+ transport system NAD-binding subunit
MNPRHVSDSLRELRVRLPETAEIWAGGSNQALRKRPSPDVRVCALDEISSAVAQWRLRQRQAAA